MISAELFTKSKEYFPILVPSGTDFIELDRRIKSGEADVFDIRINGIHQGMICGVYKDDKEKVLFFGQMGISKAYLFRNILRYSVVKLIEYFGLDGVDFIIMDAPEEIDVILFLEKLGFEFVKAKKKFLYDLQSTGIEKLVSGLTDVGYEIVDKKGQIENILKQIYEGNDAEVNGRTKKIVQKIKDMAPLEQVFWDLKVVHEINTLISAAVWNSHKLVQDEFLETIIKLMVASFENHLKEPYFEEIVAALQDKTRFSIEYFDRVIQHLKKIVPNAISKLDSKKSHIKEWLDKNMSVWEKSSENKKVFLDNKKIQTKLTVEDFGEKLSPNYATIVTSLVNHYNGDLVFFGVDRKI